MSSPVTKHKNSKTTELADKVKDQLPVAQSAMKNKQTARKCTEYCANGSCDIS